jgi:hypothetical protein
MVAKGIAERMSGEEGFLGEGCTKVVEIFW